MRVRTLKLLGHLIETKAQFGVTAGRNTAELLGKLQRAHFRDPTDLIRFHETVLFLRAYPQSPEVARLADEILFHFADLLPSDHDPFADPDISGISGTSISTNFSYEFVRSLLSRHPRDVSIDWESYEHPERLAPALAQLIPESRDDWAVEAHPDYRAWFEKGKGSLKWLLENLSPEMYNLLEIPVAWTLGDFSRSRLRLPRRKIFYHDGPLLKNPGDLPDIHTTTLDSRQAAKILGVIVDASAVRYRELYGFLYPDASKIEHADLGRGVDVFLFPPSNPLPIRDYLCGMFFKNGVPLGYIEGLSHEGNMEVGFNLYYTFRGGETVWLYRYLLKLLHQHSGVRSFSIDPYQIGHENEEAIASGAFWFYRNRGFVPESKEALRLLAIEEGKIKANPAHRTPPAMLRKLARSRLMYRLP